MSNLIKILTRILLFPVYLLAMLIGVLVDSSDLANWGSEGLGFAAKKGEGLTGSEGLIGKEAKVKVSFAKAESDEESIGKVYIRGELWNASISSKEQLPQKGELVKVLEVRGLVLKVEPIVK